MNIIIDNAFHADKINAALKQAQKGCTARIIDDAEDLVNRVKESVNALNIAKCNLAKCVLTLRLGAGSKFASSYNGIPQGTVVVVNFDAKGTAHLIDVYRAKCDSGKYESWELTPAAIKNVLRNYNASAMAI